MLLSNKNHKTVSVGAWFLASCWHITKLMPLWDIEKQQFKSYSCGPNIYQLTWGNSWIYVTIAIPFNYVNRYCLVLRSMEIWSLFDNVMPVQILKHPQFIGAVTKNGWLPKSVSLTNFGNQIASLCKHNLQQSEVASCSHPGCLYIWITEDLSYYGL